MQKLQDSLIALFGRRGSTGPGRFDRLFPVVYEELRKLAEHQVRGEKSKDALEATELVHEAYLRISSLANQRWNGREHFVRTAAKTMRRILIDHARQRDALKRGGGNVDEPLDEELVAAAQPDERLATLDEALTHFATLDPPKAQIVNLRFFGGQSVAKTAAALKCSQASVDRGWRFARAWLKAACGTVAGEA